jgi:MFS transporter, FHS family, L-fucose permease
MEKSKRDRHLLKMPDGRMFLMPFILVTSLFFLWGFAHSLLDVLNKHFQDILGISRAESGKVQMALYGGYAIMAIPAGWIMKKFGYKRGILLGLFMYACGAFLFIPAARIQTFEFTLFCLFVIACGLTCLETAANPYSSVLGPKESAERRLNFSQSFNGLGWIVGPWVGGTLILGHLGTNSDKFASVSVPYVIIGSLVVFVGILFAFQKFPEVKEEYVSSGDGLASKPLWQYRHFILAVIAQFFYVAAQTGINSFFINYVTESNHAIDNVKAAQYLSGAFVFFMSGRFASTFLMRWIKPQNILALYAFVNVIAMLLVIAGLGWISIGAFYLTYFCMSAMFPTIFALGIKGLGEHTKRASSFLVMMVAGGAVCPMFMGWIADRTNSMAIGFLVPMACFAFIAYYGLFGYKCKVENL